MEPQAEGDGEQSAVRERTVLGVWGREQGGRLKLASFAYDVSLTLQLVEAAAECELALGRRNDAVRRLTQLMSCRRNVAFARSPGILAWIRGRDRLDELSAAKP